MVFCEGTWFVCHKAEIIELFDFKQSITCLHHTDLIPVGVDRQSSRQKKYANQTP